MRQVTPALGEVIRERRVAQRLKQSELARSADVSRGHLGNIERGRSDATFRTLTKITVALDITLEMLFSDVERLERRSERRDAGRGTDQAAAGTQDEVRVAGPGSRSYALLEHMRSLPADDRWRTRSQLAEVLGTTVSATVTMLYRLFGAGLVDHRHWPESEAWAATRRASKS